MVVTGRRKDKEQVEVKEVVRDNSLDVIKESYKSVGLEYIDILTNVDYDGGFKDVGSTEYCYITLFIDQLEIQFSNTNPEFFINKKVYLKDIVDIEIKTETQIYNQVRLCNMLMFVIFSLAMKQNQKIMSDNFVVIRVKDGDSILNLIFKPQNCYDFINKINEYRNKLKLD